tara:strand:- start:351 stop:860 length:510 start_codon:yes stop_codon:yes gene_type:complete
MAAELAEAYALGSARVILEDRGYDRVEDADDEESDEGIVLTAYKGGTRYHVVRLEKIRIDHVRQPDPQRAFFICDHAPTPSAAVLLQPHEWWTVHMLQFRPSRHALASSYEPCDRDLEARLRRDSMVAPMLESDVVARHYAYAIGSVIRGTIRYGGQPPQNRFYEVVAA